MKVLKEVKLNNKKLQKAIQKLEKLIYSNLLPDEKNTVYKNNLNRIKLNIKGM